MCRSRNHLLNSITQYHHIVVALNETIRLMAELTSSLVYM